jgi:tetratricopeptide (TPR) repeat protein
MNPPRDISVCVVLWLTIGAAGCAAAMDRAVSTTTSRTSAFDRGLAMYYGFDYDAAIRAFEQASRETPAAALPNWGIALALGPSLNDPAMDGRMGKAQAALIKARKLATAEAVRARDLIDALAARYTSEARFDQTALNRSYAAKMKEVSAKHPEDDDIAVLYAESLILAEPAPASGHAHATINQPALDVVERVLRRNPRHIGANHYHIHLLEAAHPQLALASARRLDEMRPEAGHLLHMPSHIYMRLGDYHAAVQSNLRAIAADRVAQKATGQLPAMGYHTREFLAAAAGMTGQSAVARDADDNPFVKLRFNRWPEVVKWQRPKGHLSQLEWHVAQVLALAGLGRIAEAEAARAAYAAFEPTLPKDTEWWGDPVSKLLPMVRHEMDARLAWGKERREEAIAHWTQAVAAQDALTRHESIMPWFHSLRESLGAALLVSGRAREAEQVFRDDLRVNPGSGRALFGLWKALATQSRTAEASLIERQFIEAWKNADTVLTLEAL